MMLSHRTIDHLRRVADWTDLHDPRVEVGEIIGQGGMGTVYRAFDRRLQRDVALKVLRPELSNPDWTRRLERESRILAHLEHPGIVPIYDAGTLADGRSYYLMRLITGQRLDQLPATATVADRIRIFLRICETIEFAHSRGVIHRDLKPGNIMLGEFGAVLVLDWGIARVRAVTDELASPASVAITPGDTGPGTLLGTPGFRAPEQAIGGAEPDARIDIFALGAILRFLIGSEADAELPRPLMAIAARATATDPAGRYRTVKSLADDLVCYFDGHAVTAYRERFTERLTRIYTRYQVPILLVLAYLIMRLLFVVLRRDG